MRARVAAPLLALACAVVPRPASACTSANCTLLTRLEGLGVTRGTWRVDVAWRSVEQDSRLYGGRAVVVAGSETAPVLRPQVDFDSGRLRPNYHQEYAARQDALQVDLAYGLTARLAVIASVPVRVRSDVDHLFFPAPGVDLHREAGVDPSRQTLETAGFGDAQVGVRYVLAQGVGAGLALKLS